MPDAHPALFADGKGPSITRAVRALPGKWPVAASWQTRFAKQSGMLPHGQALPCTSRFESGKIRLSQFFLASNFLQKLRGPCWQESGQQACPTPEPGEFFLLPGTPLPENSVNCAHSY